MDIIIHTHHNVELPLELGYHDIVADIKHKLQTLTGVAAARQSLFHNNTPLRDDWDISRCTLFHRSHVKLLVRSPTLTNPSNSLVPFLTRLPLSKRYVTLDAGSNTRVDELKHMIGEREEIDSSLMILFLRGREMDDERLVSECDGVDKDDAVVEAGLVGSGGYAIDHLAVNTFIFLAPMNVKVPMTLNVMQSFSDLRKQLERSRKENRISLPRDWFFVFGKERVMIECLAFEKFKVQNGDVLQVRIQHVPREAVPIGCNGANTSIR
uniref:Ubiquitin-like domain-containing protein n=1 Tax=Kalanchoe fedtschenkoi TaxID=63787 RepID=A0A7N0UE63_KALFE